MAQPALKHVAKAGTRDCIVIYREIPKEPHNCIVVYTDSLTPQWHDELLSIVHGPEAQNTPDLFMILNNKQFPDGAIVLQALHYGDKLTRLGTDQVLLQPAPGQSVPLNQLNDNLRKMTGGEVPLKPVDPAAPTAVGEHLVVNPEDAKTDEDKEKMAQTILYQCQLMEQDGQRLIDEANKRREDAYLLVPELKPAKRAVGRPKKSDAKQ